IGYGTHEVQVVFRIGKKQFTRPQVMAANKPQTTPVDDNVSPLDSQRHDDEEPQDQIPPDDRPDIDQQPSERPVSQELVTQPVQQQDVAKEQPARETIRQTTPVTTPTQESQPATNEPAPVRKLDGNSLAPGHYVVVGAFRNVQNALDYTAT